MRTARDLVVTLCLLALLTGCATDPATSGLSKDERVEAAQDNTQLGVQYLRRGRLQQALRKLQKAVRQDPDNSDARMMTGVVYERLDEPELAKEFYEEAISLDEENSRALNNYGRFLCEQGEFEESRRYFERAAANPVYDNPDVPLTNAGICAMRADRSEDAEELFLRALKTNPRQSAALLRMAMIRYDAGHYLSARGYYQRYLAVARQTPASVWLGVRIEHQLGNADAVASYEQLLRGKFPDSEETRELLEWESNERL